MYQRPTIVNLALTDADTEYSYAVPAETKKMLIKSRNTGDIKLAYVSGESGTTYITIPAGTSGKWIQGVNFFDLTLYMQSPVGSDVAEIEIYQ